MESHLPIAKLGQLLWSTQIESCSESDNNYFEFLLIIKFCKSSRSSTPHNEAHTTCDRHHLPHNHIFLCETVAKTIQQFSWPRQHRTRLLFESPFSHYKKCILHHPQPGLKGTRTEHPRIRALGICLVGSQTYYVHPFITPMGSWELRTV